MMIYSSLQGVCVLSPAVEVSSRVCGVVFGPAVGLVEDQVVLLRHVDALQIQQTLHGAWQGGGEGEGWREGVDRMPRECGWIEGGGGMKG